MSRRGLRPASIVKRCAEVEAWCEHVAPLEPWHVGRAELEEYLDRRELGARSRYAAISHLHRFYVWAIREGYTSSDPTALIERPRLPRRLPRPARTSIADAAIDAAGPELALMLVLMADAGLRCCEVAALRWSAVDLELGVIYVTGKGGHDRVVGVPARLRRHLYALDDAGDGPVIGRELKPHRVSQLVNTYLRERGAGFTAHQLRHLYATRLLEATGGNLRAVQTALGHASVSSTEIYAWVDPNRAIDAARLLE